MDLQLVASSITSGTKVGDDFEDTSGWMRLSLSSNKTQIAINDMGLRVALTSDIQTQKKKLEELSAQMQEPVEHDGTPASVRAELFRTQRLYDSIENTRYIISTLEAELAALDAGNLDSTAFSTWRNPEGNIIYMPVNWEPPVQVSSPREDYEKKLRAKTTQKYISEVTIGDWFALKFDEGFRKIFGNKVADFIIANSGAIQGGAALAGCGTLLAWAQGGFAWFGGSLWSLAKLLWGGTKAALGKIGLGQRIRWLVRGKNFVFNFNWAMSDNDIRKRQEAAFKTLAGKVGETAGHGLAALVCGKAVSAVAKVEAPKLLTVNPNFLVKLAELERGTWDQPSERWEETKESLNDLIRSTASVGLQVAFLEAFKNVRSVIKAVAKGFDLSWMFPGANEMVQKWGEEDGASWSFASSLESHIESVKVDWKKEMLEEFAESFLDHCDEQLMAISYAAS